MQWNRRQARYTLLLFLLIFTTGQVKAYLTRPVYPDLKQLNQHWPPDGLLVDATALKDRALEFFPLGSTIYEAVSELGLVADHLGSGFCVPRAGVLYQIHSGWSIRPMTQRERWVWHIPMDLYACKPRDLQRINGIGPALAEKIYEFVHDRGHLDSISDLDEVPGVGPGRLERVKKELEIP